MYFTKYDVKRLELYAQNMVDYHLIVDLLPSISRLYFLNQMDVQLSIVQSVSFISVRYINSERYAQFSIGHRVKALSHRQTYKSCKIIVQSVSFISDIDRHKINARYVQFSIVQSERFITQSDKQTVQEIFSSVINFNCQLNVLRWDSAQSVLDLTH